jgi:H/ACA ribonucleoprotein complex non-core subunit NAF1
MLANYSDSEDSESGSEDEEKGPNYRNQSGTEDSESSSSSSSSESEEEMDLNTIKSKVKTAIADSDEDDDDDEGCNNRNKFRKGPLKVKGEMLLSDLPPIEDLQISVDEKECLEIGKISSIVEQLVLVEAYQNTTPLDIDSILFLEKGKKALGYIFDVIGQVSSPMYCVRFNSNEDIIAKSISVDDKVFCAPRTEYIKIVILPNIMSKGSDASWKNDIEPPPRCQEFSDDEEERHVKRQSKISNSENREFIRGRRHLPQQQLAYPNYSWHQNIPQQNPQQNPQYQFPNYNYWNNN